MKKLSKIKIYADGADKKTILEMLKNPSIKGLTTNPSLMKRAGITNYRQFGVDILQNTQDRPISFEVLADEMNEMERQAIEIAQWGNNVYVKIPITNSEGVSTMPLIKKLTSQNVKINVTAVLTLKQVTEAANALKQGAPSVISVFAGRIADTGRDPLPIMTAASEICGVLGPKIELLWASTREVLNIYQAESTGCHIITATADIINKLQMYYQNLDQLSLETVRMFKADADAAGFSL